MRVLETEVVVRYSMGKKNKHKLRKSKENEASDSSEDVAGSKLIVPSACPGSLIRDIGKQCRPRSDTTERDVR